MISEARSRLRPGPDDRRSSFLGPVPAAVLTACLVCGVAGSATAEATTVLFDRYELATGIASPQTVLTGFFLGGDTAELAVVHLDETGDPRVDMYALEGGAWVPRLRAALGSDVLLVDVAEIGGRDRLLTYESGRVSWFDPDSARERPLVEVDMSYSSAHDREGSPTEPGAAIPRVDLTRDVNHDGREDLVLPDVDGFWLAMQQSDGSFSDPVKLGPPEPYADHPMGRHDRAPGGRRTYGELGITAATIPVYLGRVHEMDYDRDGRSDLLFWNGDHFDVHLQDERGLFAPLPRTFAPDVELESDGAYSRAFEYADQGVLSLLFGIGEKSRRTVLHSLRDLNGDGIGDLVTLTLSGRSITRQRSVYRVHFGRAAGDGTAFSPDADAVIRPRGRAGGMQPWGYSSQLLQDFDGDGEIDMMFRDVDVGLGGMFRALVGHSVPVDLELYRSERGSYPERPTTRRRIRRFAPFAGWGNVFFPPVLMGDVNGDGRSDLVVGKSPRELHVFLGVAGPELLAPRPAKVEVALPADERRVRLVDLNRDGKQDLLLHLGPTERAPDRPHRLTVLVAATSRRERP